MGFFHNHTCNDSGVVSECSHRPHGQQVEVFIGLVLVVAVAFGLYIVHRKWQQREVTKEKATGLLNDASEYAKHLARHFMPSAKVAKYQFRGMQPPKQAINISFQNLGLELKNGCKVLNGVTGEFRAGRMVAIMGPSGAGKTTFMNVLCGKALYGDMTGEIYINNQKIDIKQIASVTGFVPQDDIVHESLTVREQIRFAAQLRNKAGTPKKRIEAITEDVLNVMQIDHIQNVVVGGVEARGISGGQRKRVNIGMELAAQPTLLFLDEPTSGLDSTSSLAVVYSLKKMCQLGMTCIMVIHQPRYSLFTLFDDVLLLGKGGHTVYLGPSVGAKPYFDSLGFEMPKDENRADWFMDVISGEVPNARIPEPKVLFQKWQERGANGASVPEATEGGSAQAGPGTGRDITQQEDIAVLKRKLEEEWDRIDINRDGYLDQDELKILLSQCSNLEPSDEVVHVLFERMAGEAAESLTREDFVTYLANLKSDVAADRMATTEGQSPPAGHSHPKVPFLVSRFHQQVPTPSQSTRSARLRIVETNEGSSTDAESSEASDEEAAMRSTGTALRALQRQTPGYAEQLKILSTRAVIQWWRMNPGRLIFFTAMGIGAVVLAAQDIIIASPAWDASSFVNTHTAVALLICIFCLNVFTRDQPVFWRERNRGMNVFAFYESRLHLNLIDLVMQTFLFTAIYYLIRKVKISFFSYWVPFLMVSYAASGWGYVIGTWLPPQHGPFVASLLIFVVCGLLGNPQNLAKYLGKPFLEMGVSVISITRWSIRMSFEEIVHKSPPQLSDDPADLETQMFHMYNATFFEGTWFSGNDYWWSGVWVLGIYGTVLRLLAYLGLLVRNRDKQV